MTRYTMKFGGTSVGSAEAIAAVIDIVQGELGRGNEVAVVVSAMSGITNALLKAMKLAEAGDKAGYQAVASDIRQKHEDAIASLLAPNGARAALMSEINALLDDFIQRCDAVSVLGELTPRNMDAIVSTGERASCRLVAAAMAPPPTGADTILFQLEVGGLVPGW